MTVTSVELISACSMCVQNKKKDPAVSKMATEQVTDATSSGGRSEISIARTRETLKTNCSLFVDKNFVSLGVAASEESSTAKVVSSLAASSSLLSSCELRKPLDDAQHSSCIYKRSEMARNIVYLRYLLTASFILLGISGAVVCGTGSYFVHQLHGSLTSSEWYGPPVLLLTTGIVNIILGPYFWFSLDTKRNRPQLFLFLTLVILIAIIEAGAGIWAIVDHGKVDWSIAKILENNLASVGAIDDRLTWNITEIKVKCCGFEDSSTLNDDDDEVGERNKISWSCCNTRSYNDNKRNDDADTCTVFYVNECRDLALHRYRSVLFYTFVVAFCATILQILEAIGLRAYGKRFLNKRRRHSVIASLNQPQSRVTCPVFQLGAQHVCEGCSSVQYHER